jgi:hypothetical protein
MPFDLTWQTIFTGVAALGSIFSLMFTLRDKRRQKHDAIIRSFQGEKEAVAYIAFQLNSKAWGRKENERKELVSALCLAWIFVKSDRASAMIDSALSEVCKEHKREVQTILDDIDGKLDYYAKRHFEDENHRKKAVGQYQQKLERLKAAFNMPNTKSKNLKF